MAATEEGREAGVSILDAALTFVGATTSSSIGESVHGSSVPGVEAWRLFADAGAGSNPGT